MNEVATRVPVELAPGGEVVLHVSPDQLAAIGVLVQALLAEGFDAAIAADPDAFEASVVGPTSPVLHVVCRRGDELDLQAMRARARVLSDVEHVWLDGCFGSDSPLTLVASITRALTDMEWPEPDDGVERVDVDEVSNVVLLPVPRAAPPSSVPAPAPTPTRLALAWRPHVAGIVGGALVVAAAFVGLRGDDAPSSLRPALAFQLDLPTPPRTRTLDLRRARRPVAAVPAAVEPPSAPADDPWDKAVSSDETRAADDLAVSPPIEAGTDWFRAMKLCPMRRFSGTSGWFLPTRRQLVALARARALPDALLWTRNRADREGAQAFAVGGRSGLSRATPKTNTDVAIVCVRETSPEE